MHYILHVNINLVKELFIYRYLFNRLSARYLCRCEVV